MRPDRVALDLLSCRERLAALSPAARPDNLAELAVLMGRQRLFQGPPAEPMPPDTACRAAEAILSRLPEAVCRARGLRRLWDECEEADEAVSASSALLEDRLDAWAACVALEDSQARLPGDHPLDGLVAQVWDAVADLDDAMTAEPGLFLCVAENGETTLWRSALAPEFADDLPWFLHPSMEEEAARGRACAEQAVARVLGVEALSWLSPDGRVKAALTRTPEGCLLAFAPAESLEGRAVWLGGHLAHVKQGRALVRVPPWDVGPSLELAVGKPTAKWPRLRVEQPYAANALRSIARLLGTAVAGSSLPSNSSDTQPR